ncbi:hypothetical protein BD414DRAFT_131512 [Trametes punicea]|nr:hypothetical protein BD414DRAFT_131512 [Trametes punicea]
MLTMIQGRKLPGLFEIPSRGPLFREPLSPIIPAHSNFRAYAQDAVLPRMELSPTLPPLPPPGHRSHANRLSIIWEAYRRLEYVLNITHFPQAVVEFCTTNLPTRPTGSSDGDEENGGGISVVAPAFKTGRSIPIGKPSDVDRVLRWVMEYPLATVNHMVHLVYPRTADFTLQEGKNKDDDGEIFRWVVWSRDENTITEAQDTWSESVLIMVQPPWILTEADLDWFIRTNHLPVEKPHRRLKSNERLWGKVWDMCAYKRAHWFVLTTYWGWVFGCFSKRKYYPVSIRATRGLTLLVRMDPRIHIPRDSI